jgi:hypothetical protein
VKCLALVKYLFNQVNHLENLPSRLSVVSRGDEDLEVAGEPLSEASLNTEYRC